MSRFHKRILMAVTGNILAAVSIGFFRASLFGTDPYQTFAAGLNIKFLSGMSFGTFYTLMNLVLIVVIFFLNRHYIGLVTVMSMLLTGHIAEAVSSLLGTQFPHPAIALRIGFMVFGIVVLCFAVSLYFTADLGVAAYDAVDQIIADKEGWKYKYVRIATDLLCVTVGFAFGAQIGIATLLTAFCMGPLIAFFKVHVSQPLLSRSRMRRHGRNLRLKLS